MTQLKLDLTRNWTIRPALHSRPSFGVSFQNRSTGLKVSKCANPYYCQRHWKTKAWHWRKGKVGPFPMVTPISPLWNFCLTVPISVVSSLSQLVEPPKPRLNFRSPTSLWGRGTRRNWFDSFERSISRRMRIVLLTIPKVEKLSKNRLYSFQGAFPAKMYFLRLVRKKSITVTIRSCIVSWCA